MGTQRRSCPWVIDALNRLSAGEIGRIVFARAWYNNLRPGIGRGVPVPVPNWLDFSLWQGPAPDRPFKDNLVHYNWHWHWHWGNGELGNNGIHVLDLARWGLEVGCPVRVTCGGGRYHYSDDQETPDTYVTTFDFGDKGATWESQSCHPHGFEGASSGVIFYGDQGSLVIAADRFRMYDLEEKLVLEVTGPRSDVPHFANFLDAIRDGRPLNAEIEEGQKSSLLCHLGNVAYRVGRTINLDSATRRIVGDPEAAALWSREYRNGWELKLDRY
jgi:predicted dehydrogenase